MSCGKLQVIIGARMVLAFWLRDPLAECVHSSKTGRGRTGLGLDSEFGGFGLQTLVSCIQGSGRSLSSPALCFDAGVWRPLCGCS